MKGGKVKRKNKAMATIFVLFGGDGDLGGVAPDASHEV